MATTSIRPNVFVVGDAKCGTTSLHKMFLLSPKVGVSTVKELHYFSHPELLERVSGPGDDAIARNVLRSEADYLAKFAALDPGLPAVADISPSYIRYPAAALRIRDFAPEAKIVIMLREPAAKVFSQYVHMWSKGRETLPFDQALAANAERRAAGWSDMYDYEGGGRYADLVRAYLDAFGRDRVLVLLFEELIADFPAEKARLERFLGVEIPLAAFPQANPSGRIRSPLAAALVENETLRRLRAALVPPALRARLSLAARSRLAVDKPTLDPELRAALRRGFAEDVAALEEILGRPTGWPRA
jgi:hypothetical protein